MIRLSRSAALGLAIAALAAPAATAQQQVTPPGSHPYQDLRSPDARDAAEGRGTFNAPEVTVVRIAPPSPPAEGVDWADVGIGAAFAVACGLIGAGGALMVVRRTPAKRSATSRTA